MRLAVPGRIAGATLPVASLAAVLLGGWLLRAQVTLRPDLIVGVNGAYYLVQVRAILRDGALAIPDFPLLFYLQAAIAAGLSIVLELERAIVVAVRWTDTVLPVLVAIPVFLFVRAFADPNAPRPRTLGAVLVVGLLAVGNGSLLRMAGDLPKNAAALPVSLLFLYFLYAALERRTRYEAVLAATCFAVASLMHVGAATLSLMLAGLVTLAFFALRGDRQRAMALALGMAATAAAVGVIAYTVDPNRISTLLGIILDPGSLFAASGLAVVLGIAPGLPPGATFGVEGIILGNVLGAVGVATLVVYRKSQTPAMAAVIGAASATTLFISSPLLGGQWLDRLALMSFVPGLVPLTYLACRLRRGPLVAALITAPVLISTALALPRTRYHMLTPAARDELVSLRTILPHGGTMVLARHGLEWWAAWTLDTKIANRVSAIEDSWDDYDAVLLLDETGLHAFEWGTGVGGPDRRHDQVLPFVDLEPGAFLPDAGKLRRKEITTLWRGDYFRLSQVTDFTPTPVVPVPQRRRE